jgi:two-component sensor histidine kinase
VAPFQFKEPPMVRFALASWRRLWHGGLPAGSLGSLLFALICVVIATLIRIAFGEISSASAVFAPYYAATLVAALVGGAQAGGFAAISGAVAALWFFVPSDWKSHAFDREQLVSYFLFAASSWVIIWAAKSYRDLLCRLRDEQERRQLLNRELAHRIKNTLTIVQSLVSQTLRTEPALLRKLNARLTALAATSDLLVKSQWRGARLTEILAGEFAPHDLSRFALDGADFECPAEIATMLALIFHELTTNAAKYGALSAPGGQVALSWTRTGERVDFEWRESGGPPPAAVRREGFGTALLRKGLRQFNGAVEMEFAPAGLHCRLSLCLPPQQRQTDDMAPGRLFHAGVTSAQSGASTARTFIVYPPGMTPRQGS